MTLDWLANTKLGRMVGDYVGVTYAAGKAYPAIAVARANNGTIFDEAIYSTTNPLAQVHGTNVVQHLRPVPGVHSDHPGRASSMTRKAAIRESRRSPRSVCVAPSEARKPAGGNIRN